MSALLLNAAVIFADKPSFAVGVLFTALTRTADVSKLLIADHVDGAAVVALAGLSFTGTGAVSVYAPLSLATLLRGGDNGAGFQLLFPGAEPKAAREAFGTVLASLAARPHGGRADVVCAEKAGCALKGAEAGVSLDAVEPARTEQQERQPGEER